MNALSRPAGLAEKSWSSERWGGCSRSTIRSIACSRARSWTPSTCAASTIW
jgi:hypothetical protein